MDKFLTYNNISISKKEFYQKVDELKNKFNNFFEIDDFVIIKEENPINFYTLLFALWESDKRVIFPNRDFFEGNNIEFAKYILTIDSLEENKNYKKVQNLDDKSYTILFSSGSTGKPKGIVHKKEDFFENAKSVSNRLKLSNVVSITPLKPYLVSALSHFLVHYFTDSHLIFIDIENIKDIENISTKIDNLSYVGSPLHIVSMLPFIKNQNPTYFFSSGDIFYPSVIKEIIERFPNIIFFNVYGMAELGGRLFINRLDKLSDENLYKSIGKNIDKTEIKIIDEEVNVKSDLLFDGYIIDNVFNKREDEFFKTGDKVIKNNGVLEFFGRKNDEIKVAGNKVSMKYIEQKISLILDNYTPIIINEQHDLLGNLLVLIIYSNDKFNMNRKELIQKLRNSLSTYELPHKIYITHKLPYTQTMKIDRKELKNMLNEMELLQ